VVTLDEEIGEVRPGFTCTAEITTAVREQAIAVPIQATAVRELVVNEAGEVVRPPDGDRRPRRTGGVQAAELEPGQSRKELEGVFVAVDGRARFVPVKTGIAGDRYFEVLSGLNEGDAVIVGPFASVREMADGAAVRVQTQGAAAARR
jgi:HlyD family secretion protein